MWGPRQHYFHWKAKYEHKLEIKHWFNETHLINAPCWWTYIAVYYRLNVIKINLFEQNHKTPLFCFVGPLNFAAFLQIHTLRLLKDGPGSRVKIATLLFVSLPVMDTRGGNDQQNGVIYIVSPGLFIDTSDQGRAVLINISVKDQCVNTCCKSLTMPFHSGKRLACLINKIG